MGTLREGIPKLSEYLPMDRTGIRVKRTMHVDPFKLYEYLPIVKESRVDDGIIIPNVDEIPLIDQMTAIRQISELPCARERSIECATEIEKNSVEKDCDKISDIVDEQPKIKKNFDKVIIDTQSKCVATRSLLKPSKNKPTFIKIDVKFDDIVSAESTLSSPAITAEKYSDVETYLMAESYPYGYSFLPPEKWLPASRN